MELQRCWPDVWSGHVAHRFCRNRAPISTTRGWKPRLDFQQKRPPEIEAQFEPRAEGIEPPNFCLQAWPPTNYAKFGRPARQYKSACYIAIASCPSPFWILALSTPFGSCIRYFHVTPTRVGGFVFWRASLFDAPFRLAICKVNMLFM